MRRLLFLFIGLVMPLNVLAQPCVCQDSIPLTLEIQSLYPSPAAEEVEWIKLENTSSQDLDLSFYTLEDNTESPWELSGSIAAHSTLEITGFPFQLNNGGDSVTLRTIDGEWIDSLSYSTSSSGEIITKNQNSAVEEAEETPLTTPDKWPIFSEALPNPEGSDSTDEWVELYNPYGETLSLEGLKLDDIDGGSSPYSLSGNLEAESFLLLWIEDTKVTLNNSDDIVRLLGVNGEVLWEVPYSGPKEGESYAFFSDFYDWTNNPTPGSENLFSTGEETASTDSEFQDGDLSEDIGITEVFPNPEGPDQDAEWIEITNGGTEAVNLGNWIIDDGEGGSQAFTLPDDLIIGPGETIVIERTESGIALNNSDETVQLIDFTGEVIDEIHYDTTEEGQSFSEIEVEETSNEQASLIALGRRVFTTWEWVTPTPGEANPRWKQFKGEVIDFDGSLVTLYDGISNWSFKTKASSTDELFFQAGNLVLIRAAMSNGIYQSKYSELLESATPKTKSKFPWGLVFTGLFASLWFGYEQYKKRRQNMPPSQLLSST